MAVMIAVLTAAVISLGTAYILDVLQHATIPSSCTTPACVQASNLILRNLDPSVVENGRATELNLAASSVDPCTNFDQFVCGGFELQHELRQDQADMYTGMPTPNLYTTLLKLAGTLVAEEAENSFKRIIQQDDSEVDTEDKPLLKMLRQGYSACMDESRIEKAGLEPLKDLVQHVKELLPTTKPSRADARRLQQSTVTEPLHSLSRVLAFLEQIGIDALISLQAMVSHKTLSIYQTNNA